MEVRGQGTALPRLEVSTGYSVHRTVHTYRGSKYPFLFPAAGPVTAAHQPRGEALKSTTKVKQGGVVILPGHCRADVRLASFSQVPPLLLDRIVVWLVVDE